MLPTEETANEVDDLASLMLTPLLDRLAADASQFEELSRTKPIREQELRTLLIDIANGVVSPIIDDILVVVANSRCRIVRALVTRWYGSANRRDCREGRVGSS